MREPMNTRRLAKKFGGKPIKAEKPTIKTGEGYIVLKDGTAYLVERDRCTCGYRRESSPSRGTPAEEAYRERFRESCEHQQIVMNAEPEADPCPCGCYVAERESMHERRNHKEVGTEWICKNCGRKLQVV